MGKKPKAAPPAETDDGIYAARQWTETAPGVRVCKEGDNRPLDVQLDEIEDLAERIHADCGFAAEIGRDASYALAVLWRLRRALADGATAVAARSALDLGRLHERLLVRPFEPVVRTETRRRAKRMPILAQQHAEAEDRKRTVLRKYDGLLAADPETKQTTAAKKCGVHVRTLRAYLKERSSRAG